jgi:hypothetical protein
MVTSKSEYQISKFETISKYKNSNDQNQLTSLWLSDFELF